MSATSFSGRAGVVLGIGSVGDCPDSDALAQLLEGDADPESERLLHEHLAQCSACAAVVGELAALYFEASQPSVTPADGKLEARYGRYRIWRLIGRGGMGNVYAALDPQARRKVALKVLHLVDTTGTLAREAQAMARLSHPNVVQVFDIGVDRGRTFMVSELVKGQNIRQWLALRRRDFGDIVDMMLGAAQGLAAAHRAGLVHRDFKPENVLVDCTGNARVADFGLALAPERLPSQPDQVDTADTGRMQVVGTPSYMPPEQIDGAVADERSDQFSWFVVLYEALHGQRPFVGTTLAELRAAIASGRFEPSTDATPFPPRLRAVLRRGLHEDPARRYPSMGAAMDAVRAAIKPRRRRALLALPLAALMPLLWPQARAEPPPCHSATIDEAWNDVARDQVRDAWPGADDLVADLERHAAAWVTEKEAACATGAPPVRVCLDRHARTLAAVLGAALADPGDPGELRVAVERLGSPQQCRGKHGGTPPQLDDAAATLRGDVELAEAHVFLGRYEDARALSEAAVEEAVRLGHRTVEAFARLTLGRALSSLGRRAEAAEFLRDAAYIAMADADDEMLLVAANNAAFTLGTKLGDYDEGREWIRVAFATLTRMGDPPLLEARTWRTLATLEASAGALAEAERAARTALTLTRSHVEDDDRAALALDTLASVVGQRGRDEESVALYQESLALDEKHLGADHPSLASVLSSLGASQLYAGDTEGAVASLRRADALVKAHAQAPPQLAAKIAVNLGAIRYHQGRFDEALQHSEHALELFLSVDHNPGHVAMLYSNLVAINSQLERLESATDWAERGRLYAIETLGAHSREAADAELQIATLRVKTESERALDSASAAVDLVSRAFGPEHSKVAEAYFVRGNAHQALGEYQRAVVDHDAALAITDAPAYASAKGSALHRLGRDAEASAALEHALSGLEREAEPDAERVALAQFRLAEVLGRRSRRGQTLARSALAAYEGLARRSTKETATIRSWLRG